jgi:MoxR-like ATPase
MTERKIMTPEEVQKVTELLNRMLAELDKIMLGHTKLHKLVLTGIISRGHILLEGLPGVGKTALVKALGQLLQLDFKRAQFTPDLLPGDILGTNILQESPEGYREMVFQEGPVFTNIMLADEINRASPKTQSALLEAMQDFSVTLLGNTRELPSPFFVLASQNPIEMEGTYPLPEAQLDRFMFKLSVSSVDAGILSEIITARRRGIAPEPEWTLTKEDLDYIFNAMERIHLPGAVARYIGRIVAACHPGAYEAPEIINSYVMYGASPRAAIALAEASRAMALFAGRPTVGFEDVEEVAESVLNHRVLLNYKSKMDNVSSAEVIKQLLAGIDEAELNLPSDIQVN